MFSINRFSEANWNNVACPIQPVLYLKQYELLNLNGRFHKAHPRSKTFGEANNRWNRTLLKARWSKGLIRRTFLTP